MTARIEWRHAYRTDNTLELLRIAYETVTEPTVTEPRMNRAERRRAISAIRRLR